MSYYLAIDYGMEGWKLTPYSSLSDIKEDLLSGQTYGNKFKVFRELEIKIEDALQNTKEDSALRTTGQS